MRTAVLAAIDRIARAEAAASGADRAPETEVLDSFPVTVNDSTTLRQVNEQFTGLFGEQRLFAYEPATGSEDAGLLATGAGAPLYYWWLGGWDPEEFRTALAAGRLAQDIPSNHSPHFVPVVRPTLTMGVEALTAAGAQPAGSGGRRRTGRRRRSAAGGAETTGQAGRGGRTVTGRPGRTEVTGRPGRTEVTEGPAGAGGGDGTGTSGRDGGSLTLSLGEAPASAVPGEAPGTRRADGWTERATAACAWRPARTVSC